MHELERLLRRDDIGVKVTCGYVWLYFDDTSSEWVVKNKRRTIYRRPILKHAVEWFDQQWPKIDNA